MDAKCGNRQTYASITAAQRGLPTAGTTDSEPADQKHDAAGLETASAWAQRVPQQIYGSFGKLDRIWRAEAEYQVGQSEDGGGVEALARALTGGSDATQKETPEEHRQDKEEELHQCTADEAQHLAVYLLSPSNSSMLDSSRETVAAAAAPSLRFSHGNYDASVPIVNARARGSVLIASPFKLRHDADQLLLLLQRHKLHPSFLSAVYAFARVLNSTGFTADALELIAIAPGTFQPLPQPSASATVDNDNGVGRGLMTSEGRAFAAPFLLRADQQRVIAPYFNMQLYLPPTPRLPPSPSQRQSTLSASLLQHAGSIQSTYREEGLVVVDGVLSGDALAGLQRFAEEATVFHEVKHGYLGAYFDEGLSSPLLEQVVEELRAVLPSLLGELPLVQAWMYKYDTTSAPDGIGIHADAASVNLNLWLTDDSSNLLADDSKQSASRSTHTKSDEGSGSPLITADSARSGGGLLVWPQEPQTQDWSFESYNGGDAATQAALLAFVQAVEEEEGARRVEYRCNRMVLFKSTLLHRTEPVSKSNSSFPVIAPHPTTYTLSCSVDDLLAILL
eukprot:COSAG05_NODE_642_length_8135_cov_20.343703_8_plen_563_part_00